MEKHFPDITHETAHITKGMRSPEAERHIAGLMAARRGGFDAVYLVAAYNTQFIRALEEKSIGRRVIVLHDLDSSSNHYLEKNLLTAVVYQNPILQGYYTVTNPGEPPRVGAPARRPPDQHRAQRDPQREQGPVQESLPFCPYGGVSGAPMDERDAIIEALKKENEALRAEIGRTRESEERYRTLYDALPVSLMLVDRDGIIVGVNPFHLKNMGKGKTKESDYVGQYIGTRRSILASGLADKLTDVLKGVPFEEDEVLFPALSGGGEGYFNFRGVPLANGDEIIGAIYISMDVTALRGAKDELRRHKERLEEIVEARVSELRTAYERLRDENAKRRAAQAEKEKLIGNLQEALAKVKTLSGFIPICASCKKIRDDKGFWNQLEAYLSEHSEIEFSHSLCPDCARKLYPELMGGI